MLIKFKVTNGDNVWWEELVANIPLTDTPRRDAKRHIRRIIRSFNARLCPGEKARQLLKVRVKDLTVRNHEWEKVNLVTIMGKGHLTYDVYRCKMCGHTSKRYGLAEHFIPDKGTPLMCLCFEDKRKNKG